MTAYTSAARISDLFDAARQARSIQELVEACGLKVSRAGSEMRSACPVCGAGQKSRSAFAIKGEKWRCYGSCDVGGDVVDLEQALRGGTPVEAARRLVGRDVPIGPARPRPATKAPEGPSVADRLAAEIWEEARPFTESTLGWRYLVNRGISPDVIAMAAPNLRYHPFAKHSWRPSQDAGAAGEWVKAPAMVVQPVTPSGPTGGIHCTYLARDGSGKAALPRAKLMWGQQLCADGSPGAAWLIGPDGDGDLVGAEGIETSLSVATIAWRAGIRQRVFAALSLSRLQGGIAKDDDGCFDPFNPKARPQSPAFTWPTPADAPWREVMIAVDRDMSPVKAKARTGRGRIAEIELGAEVRARICGRLAVAAWKAAGAPRVRAIAPSPGSDFNDELRRLLARERAA